MSVFLRLGQLYLPPSVKRKRLEQLFTLTAEAFGRKAPRMEGISLDEILEIYARFTREEAEKSICRPEAREQVRERLYLNAFTLGCELRRKYRIKTLRDALQMGRIIYRVMKIDFRGDAARGIVIKKCFFSNYYSAEVCALISAIDEGIMAGLTSGMRIRFIERLTDGSECCRAYFGIDEGAS
jgi:hypothetical protein